MMKILKLVTVLAAYGISGETEVLSGTPCTPADYRSPMSNGCMVRICSHSESNCPELEKYERCGTHNLNNPYIEACKCCNLPRHLALEPPIKKMIDEPFFNPEE
ncbi:uncharacterized protein LOC134272139 [Saccostrea cucullata]|uniref:uncharacterized protein LOC134272139 n=1 Tax=Saccostrea cuccullata TaxID=36930 RepID=UPI002ED1F278